jgi:hypothetical protein
MTRSNLGKPFQREGGRFERRRALAVLRIPLPRIARLKDPYRMMKVQMKMVYSQQLLKRVALSEAVPPGTQETGFGP